ncbi:MAG: aspartate--tRNA(Asn) ligase [Nitrososphaeraceae archaeon]|nr:aspartate--tRNA(Asn) ligase [Nitrososphaeraceae archaeon]MDW0139107.1 aspartate--tRNA(Asn) ligase [Nitrososphaeraceae archaeon]MDW0144817.1 aspartate--tRNA(Asn) ligase [Nitrososphaeraceae archaeon]MDW0153450.1 aspartate--tRNA(Asn) ligase [Nitrososphaeraceae archaeon]
MNSSDLQTWKRTHYSKNIDISMNGKEVIIIGWISSIREHSNIKFLTINDRFGNIQVILKKNEFPDSLSSEIPKIREHASIAIKGKVRGEPKAPNGIEIIPIDFKILSFANKNSPIVIQSRKGVGIDTRLDLRAIDLRRPYLQSIFSIRYTVLNSCRKFLGDEGFIEVNTPKIIATATEGGATLFPIFYYDREAFLTQSPQLYKEQLTMAFENVFEIGPIFRAEPSRTNRHLSEATSIDIEKAYADYNDIMEILERLIHFLFDEVKNKNKSQLEYLKIEIPDISFPFRRYRYSDLIEKLQGAGESIEWGDDISQQKLRNLNDGDMKNFYFIFDWPTSIKPFYVKPKSTGTECESFDLMYDTLELSSGSTRIHDKNELTERMKKQGLSTDAFDFHLKVFDYGMPPHAGFGLGLERLMMSMCGVDNIRDVVLFPRDIDRLSP